MPLSQTQKNVKDAIIAYGENNGFSYPDIQLAVNVAYIESSFGADLTNSKSTAGGLYQYLNSPKGNRWSEVHSDLDRSSQSDQIIAFYRDLKSFTGRYNNLSDEVRGDVTRDEYVYIKHHDGSSYEHIQTAPGRKIYNTRLAELVGSPDENILDFEYKEEKSTGDPTRAADNANNGNRGFNLGFPRDPFVLDLDGDGIELGTLADSQAYFDLNGDGFATRTSWLKGDDGFLALDRNQDGKINDITELFGSPDRTGYEELSELDSNADGVIDKADERFAELLVWQDVNEDGISQADELKSLTEAGIVSISLTHASVTDQQGDGQLARRGSFTWKDGTQGTAGETPGIAADVLFAQHPTFS